MSDSSGDQLPELEQQLTQEQQDRNELLGQTGDSRDERVIRELRASNTGLRAVEGQVAYIGEAVNNLTGMMTTSLENTAQLLQGQEQAQQERSMIMRQIDGVDLRVKKGFESITKEALSCFDTNFLFQSADAFIYCIYLMMCWLVMSIVNLHRLYVGKMVSTMSNVHEICKFIPLIGLFVMVIINSVVLAVFLAAYTALLGILLSMFVNENLTHELIHGYLVWSLDSLMALMYHFIKKTLVFFWTGLMFNQVRDIWNATTGKLLYIIGAGFSALIKYSVCYFGGGDWWGTGCTQLEEYEDLLEEMFTSPTMNYTNYTNSTNTSGGGADILDKFKEETKKIIDMFDEMDKKVKEKVGSKMYEKTEKLGDSLLSELLKLDSNKGIGPIIDLSTRVFAESMGNSNMKHKSVGESEYSDKMKRFMVLFSGTKSSKGLIDICDSIFICLKDIGNEKDDEKISKQLKKLDKNSSTNKKYNELLKKMSVKSKFKTDELSSGLYKLSLLCVDKSRIPGLLEKIMKMMEGKTFGKEVKTFVKSKKYNSLLRSIPNVGTMYGTKKKTLKKKKKKKKKSKTKKKKTVR